VQLFLTVIILVPLSEYCLKQIHKQSFHMNISHTGVLSATKPVSKVTEMLVYISLQTMLFSWMKARSKTGIMQMKWHLPISLIDFSDFPVLPHSCSPEVPTQKHKGLLLESGKTESCGFFKCLPGTAGVKSIIWWVRVILKRHKVPRRICPCTELVEKC